VLAQSVDAGKEVERKTAEKETAALAWALGPAWAQAPARAWPPARVLVQSQEAEKMAERAMMAMWLAAE
jgi:hypothetical protein